jgi:hypothetical protein
LELEAKVFFISFGSIFHYYDFLNRWSSFFKVFMFFQIVESSILFEAMSYLQMIAAFTIITINFLVTQLAH